MSQSKYRQGKYIGHRGVQRWFKDGKLHREDGPAIIESDGSEYWYKNGKLHREDGPAIACKDGTKHYYLNGKEIKEEDYLKVLNCPIDELPLYINTKLAPLVKRRLNHDPERPNKDSCTRDRKE
jgi:hypothetical protein